MLGWLTDWIGSSGHILAFLGAFIAAFGALLSHQHSTKESDRLREELLAKNEQLIERADEIAFLQGELRGVAEQTMCQVTGEGGYPTVVPLFSQISPEIVKRKGIDIPDVLPATFRILNNSAAPVIAPHVSIMKTVPMGTGFWGSNTEILFQAYVETIYPDMVPIPLNVRTTIEKSRENWFDVLVFSPAAKFTERVVVVWDGEQWQTDLELKRLADEKRGIEEKLIRTIREDFPFLSEDRR